MSSADTPLVMHVIHHLLIGGMENGLVNLINNMPPDRFRHVVMCIEDYSDFRQRIRRPGVDVIALHRSRIGVWGLRRELLRWCRRLSPRIVHSRNLSGLDALVPAKLAGVKRCIHSEHGFDVDNLDGRNVKTTLLRRLHSPLIDRYVTVSRDLERFLIEHIGIRAERIEQIYNGVDTERFLPSAFKRVDLLPEAFRDPALMIIGTVGRAQPIKSQATLLHALAAARAQQPQAAQAMRIVVFGEGPELPALQVLACTLGLGDQVWFPGATQDVPAAMHSMDVFVLPSLNEGISNTILEAMASGLPVLATAVGGNVELVAGGVSGELFAPTDSDALAALLLKYYFESALRSRHGHAGRARACEHFSLHNMVRRYLDLYERVDR